MPLGGVNCMALVPAPFESIRSVAGNNTGMHERWRWQRHGTTGQINTGTGEQALWNNTTGVWNTATGVAALPFNTNGGYNTADGVNALLNNTSGNYNTADGVSALKNNITGGNDNSGYGSIRLERTLRAPPTLTSAIRAFRPTTWSFALETARPRPTSRA